jgi:hypothetical protein
MINLIMLSADYKHPELNECLPFSHGQQSLSEEGYA